MGIETFFWLFTFSMTFHIFRWQSRDNKAPQSLGVTKMIDKNDISQIISQYSAPTSYKDTDVQLCSNPAWKATHQKEYKIR